jgi:hypothetical protein
MPMVGMMFLSILGGMIVLMLHYQARNKRFHAIKNRPSLSVQA